MTNGINNSKPELEPITQITVAGYKSIREEQSIEIAPLTLLAGANSSGKSSIMQPLLLLKQTLDALYDPGALLINGPHLQFNRISQLFTRINRSKQHLLNISLSTDSGGNSFYFGIYNQSLDLVKFNRKLNKSMFFEVTLSQRTNEYAVTPETAQQLKVMGYEKIDPFFTVERSRCYFEIVSEPRLHFFLLRDRNVDYGIRGLIHIPGLRKTYQRGHPVTAVGENYFGTFEPYVASIMAYWKEQKSDNQIKLDQYLQHLGLTWGADVNRVDDAQYEILVGRTRKQASTQKDDWVNIADVGFGVSQVLPVLVALLAARPGQLVYIEQPELHLHPRAQVAMAKILAEAAQRGVRVVAETHSSLLLTGVQTLVAEGSLEREKVKLHWFRRDEDTGETTVHSADLDETGAFGDWPEDFDDVALETEGRYITAAQLRLAQRNQS